MKQTNSARSFWNLRVVSGAMAAVLAAACLGLGGCGEKKTDTGALGTSSAQSEPPASSEDSSQKSVSTSSKKETKAVEKTIKPVKSPTPPKDGSFSQETGGLIQHKDEVQKFFYNSAARLFQSTKAQNQAYSPASCYLALSMLTEATGGETRSEIVKALGADSLDTARKNAKHILSALYYDTNKAKCKLANSAWLSDQHEYRKETLDSLSNHHFASVFSVPFGTKETENSIGKWISDNTGGMLGDDPVMNATSPEDMMVLFNTVYLNAHWDVGFYKEQGKGDFTLSSGKKVKAQYMTSSTRYCDVAQTTDAEVIQWRFTSGYSMTFLLPKKNLTARQLSQDADKLYTAVNAWDTLEKKDCEVTLTIPEFGFSTDYNLAGTAQALGIKKAFDTGKADFSPLFPKNKPQKGVFVSDILQQAKIKVDETGCEAAAVTKITMSGSAMPKEQEKKSIKFDRPFVFVLRGQEIPLFIGVVDDPTQN